MSPTLSPDGAAATYRLAPVGYLSCSPKKTEARLTSYQPRTGGMMIAHFCTFSTVLLGRLDSVFPLNSGPKSSQTQRWTFSFRSWELSDLGTTLTWTLNIWPSINSISQLFINFLLVSDSVFKFDSVKKQDWRYTSIWSWPSIWPWNVPFTTSL